MAVVQPGARPLGDAGIGVLRSFYCGNRDRKHAGKFSSRPDVNERVSALTGYLQRELESQPLHNKAAVLWASSKLPGILSEAARKAIIVEILSKQQSDGGWTIESLGPWAPHPQAVQAQGSNSYGTAFVTFALQQGGIDGRMRN